MGAPSFSLQLTASLRSRGDDLKACVYQPIKCLVSDQVSNGWWVYASRTDEGSSYLELIKDK